MKTLLLLLASALAVSAQVSVIDLAALHTNATTSAAQITITNAGLTNVWYVTTNPAAISHGDSLPTAFGKVNSSFAWVAASVTNLNNLYTFVSTNNLGQIAAISNRVNLVITNGGSGYTLGGTFTGTGTGLTLQGTNLAAGSVETNSFTTGAMTWLNGYQTALDAIKAPGSSGSETVLKLQSPDGTTWYLHVSDLGVLTVTGSP